VGNVSPNLFVTFLGQKSCFDCVWVSLGFQNGFCWVWKRVCEMSRVLYLFGLVIAGVCVKMIGFECLVDLGCKTEFFLLLHDHRVATQPRRVAMCVWSVRVRGSSEYRVAIPSPSRRDPRSEDFLAPRSLFLASRPVPWSRRDLPSSRRDDLFCLLSPVFVKRCLSSGFVVLMAWLVHY